MKKLILLLVVVGVVGGLWFRHALSPVDSANTKSEAVNIEQGTSLAGIVNLLSDRDLIRSPLAFKIYVRFTGNAAKMQAGAFAISPSQSVSEIVHIIATGKSEEFNITIPEGYTVADIDALLASKGLGKPGDIIDCAFTCDFSTFEFLPAKAAASQKQGIGSRLEGYLFPETYAASPADYVPKFFLERMLGTFRKRVVIGHGEEIKASGHTLHDVIIMASLVEEESRHDDERAKVAGILWKRLKNGVVLGVDATTRYVLGKRTEALTKADVETDSDYNTRRTQGLPPSPIANPGESAIEASLKPVETEYWYYLHDKSGIIRYAVTNDEHNANKARYLGR